PEFAVAGSDARRPATAIAFRARHAVALVVGQRGDRLATALREVDQLLPVHARDAAIAAHPEPAAVVRENLEDAIVEQAVFRGVAREASILEAAQAAVVGANPQRAVRIQPQCPDRRAGKTVLLRPGCEPAVAVVGQAAVT